MADQANGSPPVAEGPESYERWARDAISRTFHQLSDNEVQPGTWVWSLAAIGGAAVYALLEIARAIREARS